MPDPMKFRILKNEKEPTAQKDMPGLRQTLFVAQKMGEKLGRRYLLQ